MSFFAKLKKVFSWIPFLWKLDDGSYESLYQVNIRQLGDIQKEILKFADVFPEGIDFCFQIEEAKRNLQNSTVQTDADSTQRYVDRAFEIIKQNSTEWWI